MQNKTAHESPNPPQEPPENTPASSDNPTPPSDPKYLDALDRGEPHEEHGFAD